MFDKLAGYLSSRPRRRRLLMTLLLIVLGLFLALSFTGFWGASRFRDALIARKYEGSLSGDLGFLAVLTSEASRNYHFESPLEQQRTEKIKRALAEAKVQLEGLKPVPQVPAAAAPALEATSDDSALLQLLGSPLLANLSPAALGLATGPRGDPTPYPYLESSPAALKVSSFVFIPAPLVDVQGLLLSPRLRRDLVFSKIAERRLLGLLARLRDESIYQAYDISCGDFIRLADARSDDPRRHYSGKFWPLQSFVDRTYFRETRRAPHGFRQSEPYIDAAGGGLINTYSVFFRNDALRLCGMLGVDRRLEDRQSMWKDIDLGALWGPLRDFDQGTYVAHEIQDLGKLSTSQRTKLAADIERRSAEINSGIRRIELDRATVFTAPRGDGKIALFVFDPDHTNSKYTVYAGCGILVIIVFAVMVWLDNSAQRDAKNTQQSQSEIVANLQGGFVVVDERDRIVATNDRFSAMVGAAGIGELITSRLAPESSNEYSQLKERGGFEFAGRVRHQDGRFGPVIITSAPLSYQGKRNQRMLILINSADLEQTIARRFLNTFSHALKSPVHSIILIADLFRRKNALPKFDHYFSQMQRKVQEFSTLTDNVLRFSALDVKEISIEPCAVNVAKVLRTVLSAARERARAQGLVLSESIAEELRVETDAALLQVVLNNLIDNALKYTPRGGISVHAEDLLTKIRIVVADTGPGVPKAEREEIFSLFFQGARPGARSREGLGLGLYISRRYIQAIGGSLTYEPVQGDNPRSVETEELLGSRFIVELPKHGGERRDERDKQECQAETQDPVA